MANEVMVQVVMDYAAQSQNVTSIDAEKISSAISNYKIFATGRGLFMENESLVSINMSKNGGNFSFATNFCLDKPFENEYGSYVTLVGGSTLDILIEPIDYFSANQQPYNRQGVYYMPCSFERLGKPIEIGNWRVYAGVSKTGRNSMPTSDVRINDYHYTAEARLFIDESNMSHLVNDLLEAFEYDQKDIQDITGAIKSLVTNTAYGLFFM